MKTMKTTNLSKLLQPAALPLLAVFAASSVAALAGDCSPQLPGIAAWWRAEGNALDSIGQNNGTLQGGTTFSAGIVGQCFTFDGSSGFIDIADTASMDFGTGDFTIAGWVRFPSLATVPDPGSSSSGSEEIIHKVVGLWPNDQTYFLEYTDGPAFRFMVHDTAANENDFTVAAPLAVGIWYHVAAVRAGNTNRVYLDGLLLGEQVAGSHANTGTGGIARIGRIAPNGIPGLTRFFHGDIDEFCLYSRALTSSDIQQIVCSPTLSIRVSQVELCWNSQSNGLYQVEYRSDLTTNIWTALGGQILATNSPTCTQDTVTSGQPHRCYRVVRLP